MFLVIIFFLCLLADCPAAHQHHRTGGRRADSLRGSRDSGVTAQRNGTDALEPDDDVIKKTSRHVAQSEKVTITSL